LDSSHVRVWHECEFPTACALFNSSIPSVTFASRRRFEPVEDALEVDEEGGPMSLDLAEMVGDTQIDQRLMGAFDLALGSG
jgi:hypothetical protein